MVVIVKLFASIFIVFITVITIFWCLPPDYLLRKITHTLFARAVIWCGLDNFWSLFAPQPVSKNFLIGFEIECADGTCIPWKLPEFKMKNDFQHIEKTRIIKWHNMLLSQKDAEPKEAVCRYILQEFLNQNDTGKKPSLIHIIRYYQPEQFFIDDINWLSRRAYTYTV